MALPAPKEWDADPVLTIEHLTMRFGGLVAVGDPLAPGGGQPIHGLRATRPRRMVMRPSVGL